MLQILRKINKHDYDRLKITLLSMVIACVCIVMLSLFYPMSPLIKTVSFLNLTLVLAIICCVFSAIHHTDIPRT